MTVCFVDTSVAVALVLSGHVAHRSVSRAVGRRQVHLAGHAAIETYSVLTRLPGDAKVSAVDAVTLLADRFPSAPALPPNDGPDVVLRLAGLGIVGGAVYDGIVALAIVDIRDAVLISRDLRAAATYDRVGVAVELVRD